MISSRSRQYRRLLQRDVSPFGLQANGGPRHCLRRRQSPLRHTRQVSLKPTMRRSNSAIIALCCSAVSPSIRPASAAACCLNDFGRNALISSCSVAVENRRELPAPRGTCPRLSARLVLFSGLSPGLLLPPLREAERRSGAKQRGTIFRRRPACRFEAAGAPSGAPPRRFVTRSPYFFVGRGDFHHSPDPGSIGAALHPIVSKPLKAGPSSGPDGDRASWDGVT